MVIRKYLKKKEKEEREKKPISPINGHQLAIALHTLINVIISVSMYACMYVCLYACMYSYAPSLSFTGNFELKFLNDVCIPIYIYIYKEI